MAVALSQGRPRLACLISTTMMTDLDVHIHSLRLDEEGNVQGAPESYRRFFMEETKRSLGL